MRASSRSARTCRRRRVKLMQTVAAAIREDLAKVKDVLDIFVRRGGGPAGGARPAGRAAAQDRRHARRAGPGRAARQRAERDRAAGEGRERDAQGGRGHAGGDRRDADQRRGPASTISLVGLILPRDVELPQAAGGDNEFQQVQSAVLRECIVNLARIKEAIAQSVGGTLDAAGLDSWQDLMRGIKAGLLMLGKGRAVDVIDGITGQLQARDAAGRARRCRRASSTVWPTPSSASSTTWRRCRRDARSLVHARQRPDLRPGACRAAHPFRAGGAAGRGHRRTARGRCAARQRRGSERRRGRRHGSRAQPDHRGRQRPRLSVRRAPTGSPRSPSTPTPSS